MLILVASPELLVKQYQVQLAFLLK